MTVVFFSYQSIPLGEKTFQFLEIQILNRSDILVSIHNKKNSIYEKINLLCPYVSFRRYYNVEKKFSCSIASVLTRILDSKNTYIKEYPLINTP
jgi:hypothetical protein